MKAIVLIASLLIVSTLHAQYTIGRDKSFTLSDRIVGPGEHCNNIGEWKFYYNSPSTNDTATSTVWFFGYDYRRGFLWWKNVIDSLEKERKDALSEYFNASQRLQDQAKAEHAKFEATSPKGADPMLNTHYRQFRNLLEVDGRLGAKNKAYVEWCDGKIKLAYETMMTSELAVYPSLFDQLVFRSAVDVSIEGDFEWERHEWDFRGWLSRLSHSYIEKK